MRSVKITNIKPTVLVWARESIGLSIAQVNDELNKGLKTKIDITTIENGDDHLIFIQLKNAFVY